MNRLGNRLGWCHEVVINFFFLKMLYLIKGGADLYTPIPWGWFIRQEKILTLSLPRFSWNYFITFRYTFATPIVTDSGVMGS